MEGRPALFAYRSRVAESNVLLAAVARAGASATGTAATAHGVGRFYRKAHVGKINLHCTRLGQQAGVDAEGEFLFIENRVVIVWLIQSQCQAGAASATGRKINPYAGFFLIRKIRRQFLVGAFRQCKHRNPP